MLRIYYVCMNHINIIGKKKKKEQSTTKATPQLTLHHNNTAVKH